MPPFQRPHSRPSNDSLWRKTAKPDFNDPSLLWGDLWDQFNTITIPIQDEDAFFADAIAAAACAEDRKHLHQLLAEMQQERQKEMFRVVNKIATTALMRRDKLNCSAARSVAAKVGRTGSLDSFVQFVGGSVFGWEGDKEERQLGDGHGDDESTSPLFNALSPVDLHDDDDLPSESGSQPHWEIESLPSSFVLEPTPDREEVEPLLGHETTTTSSEGVSTATATATATAEEPEHELPASTTPPPNLAAAEPHQSSSLPPLQLQSTSPSSHTSSRVNDAQSIATTPEPAHKCSSSTLLSEKSQSSPSAEPVSQKETPSTSGLHERRLSLQEAHESDRSLNPIIGSAKRRRSEDDSLDSSYLKDEPGLKKQRRGGGS